MRAIKSRPRVDTKRPICSFSSLIFASVVVADYPVRFKQHFWKRETECRQPAPRDPIIMPTITGPLREGRLVWIGVGKSPDGTAPATISYLF